MRLRSVPPGLVVSQAKTEPEEPIDNAAPTDDEVPVGPSPVDTLSEMMAGLVGANNSRISIYRIVKNQPPSYVAECDPASFSLDDLRDRHGGGEFRLYIMKDGRIWKNMRVFVEPPPRGSEPPTAVASHMGDVLAVMRDGFAAQASAMRELAARPAGQSPLSNLDLPAVITAISGAIVALRPPPAPPMPPPADTSRAVDMLLQGIQLARELREDAAPADNSIGGMLRSFLTSPVVAKAVEAASLPSARQEPQRPALPPAPPQPSAPPQPQQPPTDMFTQYYALLTQKAAAGADPTLYAELILDSVDDDTLNMLLTKQPTPLDALIAEYPPAAPHREWFATLINTLMEAMVPEEESAAAAPVQPVNGANVDAPLVQPTVVPGQPS